MTLNARNLSVTYTSVAGDQIEAIKDLSLEINGRVIEKCPGRTPLELCIPLEDFETKMWVV